MSETTELGNVLHGPEGELERRRSFLGALRNCPVPEDELLQNLGLFLTPQSLSRVLFMDFLYRQILETQGIVVEFGCRWGQNLSLFSSLRGIYEPFNRLRKIVGFDTFEGLPEGSGQDGGAMRRGMYAVPAGYESYLDAVLTFQEAESPLSHLKKFEIVKGDATTEIQSYLERNPETIVALAYFDMDIYRPTRECLLAIKDRLTIGSVIGFDELNDHLTPGETVAVKEVLGLSNHALRRYPQSARTSYMVYGKA